MRARYYDPATGRFISRDPILSPIVGSYGSFWFVPHLVRAPQRLHPYVYVQNNPVNRIDPTGLTDSCREQLERCKKEAKAWKAVCMAGVRTLGIALAGSCVKICVAAGPFYLKCLKACLAGVAKTVAQAAVVCKFNYAAQLVQCLLDYRACKDDDDACKK